MTAAVPDAAEEGEQPEAEETPAPDSDPNPQIEFPAGFDAFSDLTDFQKHILSIIQGCTGPADYDGKLYGLAIKRELKKYYDGKIHHGRLYPNLDDLVKKGFLEKNDIDQRTNVYTLTEKGEKCLDAQARWVAAHHPALEYTPGGGSSTEMTSDAAGTEAA